MSLLRPYDVGVFYAMRTVEGVPIVTPVQCYLDVQSIHSRGKEAGEAILREVLQPRWKEAA